MELDESKQEFIEEGQEILLRVSEELRKVEQGKANPDYIDAIYRDIHTLKGTSYLFGFIELGNLAHVIETCLDPIRSKQMDFPILFMSSLLESLDLIEKMLFAIRDDVDLKEYANQVDCQVGRVIDAACVSYSNDKNHILNDPIFPEEIKAMPELKPEPNVNNQIIETEKDDVCEEPVKKTSQPIKVAEKTVAIAKEEEAKSNPASEKQAGKSAASSADTSIRVQVGLLDNIMNLVGELVLVRNQVRQLCTEMDSGELQNLAQRLDLVTADLQGDIMKTRMQPIGNVINKFHRTVRDVSHELGKKIQVDLEGMETELDKTLLEAIKDPLTHIIRNACDHGLETPAQRKETGKPETGQIGIKAYHEGGHVIIDIQDDGRGIDPEKIVSKAIEKNIISASDRERLSERDIYHLIFSPGFSTAEKVSAVSGRGVGMDVVKTNIEQIGGAVEIKSTLGEGTQIQLRIPLTLAIVAAMVVQAGQNKYAIPQGKVLELVRVDSAEKDSELKVERVQNVPVLRLRGALLPLIFLNDVFSSNPASVEDSDLNIVVLKSDQYSFGLVVDEIYNTADIVVKPLENFLKSLELFSGATIMGDGSVSLILDVSGIGARAHLKPSTESSIGLQSNFRNESEFNDTQEYLTFKLSGEPRFAVPLCMVNRLEEFTQESVEYSGEQAVVRYRDSLLPLLDVEELLGMPLSEERHEALSAIVVEKQNRKFGLIVRSIEDVVSHDQVIDDSIRDRPGILGNIMDENEMMVVIDVYSMIAGHLEKFESTADVQGANAGLFLDEEGKTKKEVKILLAEDTLFFRKHVSKLLVQAGYNVRTADDGRIALDIISAAAPGDFDAIVTDIEMPNMNGLELTKGIRKLESYRDVPVIALTTKVKKRDIEAGVEAGLTEYLEKLDGDELVTTLEKLVS